MRLKETARRKVQRALANHTDEPDGKNDVVLRKSRAKLINIRLAVYPQTLDVNI